MTGTRRGSVGRRWCVLMGCLVELLMLGCGDQPLSPSSEMFPPGDDVADLPTGRLVQGITVELDGAASSLPDLGVEVLEALHVRDTSRLNRVRLTEFEHNELVWPELPASAPEANFPVDFAWDNIQVRNYAALRYLLSEFGALNLEYVHSECRGPTERFDSFVVLTDCWVIFSENDLRRHTRQLFKDVLVWDGQYKIFRYYDE